MVMAKYYRYEKADVYPRVDYFQRMLRSLLLRFLSVISYFNEFYHDKRRIDDIKRVVEMLLRPPNIYIMSGSEPLDVGRTAALKKAYIQALNDGTLNEVEETQIDSDDLAMVVIVHYCKGSPDAFLDSFIPTMKMKLDNLDAKRQPPPSCSEHVISPTEDVYSKLFIACDLECRDEETSISKEKIHNRLTIVYGNELIEKRLLVGKSVDIGGLISSDLESRVFIGFDNIDNYLRELRKHDPTCYKVTNNLTEDKRIWDFFEVSLSNVERLSLTLDDLCEIIGNEQDSKMSIYNESTFLIIFTEFIALGIKGVVIQILFERFSLSQILTHQCLEKIDFLEKIKTSLADSVDAKKHISRSVFISVKKYLSSETKITNSKRVKFTELTGVLVKVLDSVFRELENEVLEVDKHVKVVKKMNFEISGYYKRTKTREDRNTPTVPFSKELQQALFSCKDVVGCGFIYGIFEVLVLEESEDEAIEDAIRDIMNHHRYIGQYSVKRVKANNSFL